MAAAACGLAGFVLVWALPRAWVGTASGTYARLANRRLLACAAVFVTVVATRAVLLLKMPVPLPAVPDEFSYLLMGKMIARGHVSYPTHAMWQHFETLFVLQRPRYASVYPPAQGLALGIPIALGAHPWIGVLCSNALFCAAVCWMLQGFVPPRWALSGALLTVAQVSLFSYWMNSYWGGAVSATGGALVIGALGRIRRQMRARDLFLLAAGLAMLLNSRPYEGLSGAIPAIAFVLWLNRHSLRGPARAAVAAATPALVLLGAVAIGTAWYLASVTGSPLRHPYQVYFAQYAATPAFVWQGPVPAPQYTDAVLRDAHLSLRVEYDRSRSLRGFVSRTIEKLRLSAAFYLGPLWILAVLALPWLVRMPNLRVPLVFLGFCLFAVLMAVPYQPHYLGPAASVFALIAVTSIRVLMSLAGIRLAALRMAVCCAAVVLLLGLVFLNSTGKPQSRLAQRDRIERDLARLPEPQLVIVRYGGLHSLGEEWVYNEPDIDGAHTVWARDLGPRRNAGLLAYFSWRRAWLLLADNTPARLVPYGRDSARVSAFDGLNQPPREPAPAPARRPFASRARSLRSDMDEADPVE